MDALQRAELSRAVTSILEQTDAEELGFYLHGSQRAGSASEESDVDVLGLVADPISDGDLQGLRSVAAAVAESTELNLDLKIHRLDVFGRDQYVGLEDQADFIGGVDLRDRLPERSFDDACHEQVAIACQILRWGSASEHEGWRGSAKNLGHLASALIAARDGYVARGGVDAARQLIETEPALGTAIHAHITLQTRDDSLLQELASRTRDALLNPLVPLGPRCRATIDAALGAKPS